MESFSLVKGVQRRFVPGVLLLTMQYGFAQTNCPLIREELVKQYLGEDSELVSADPSGFCTWTTTKSCNVTPLPEFGPNAFASYNCPAPGNLALSVHHLVGKTHADIVLNPGTRAAGSSDLENLKPLIKHVHARLSALD